MHYHHHYHYYYTIYDVFVFLPCSWEHVTYEKAIEHAYVSGEDGLLGYCDKYSFLCTSLGMWNGKDPILKERLFGVNGLEVQLMNELGFYSPSFKNLGNLRVSRLSIYTKNHQNLFFNFLDF